MNPPLRPSAAPPGGPHQRTGEAGSAVRAWSIAESDERVERVCQPEDAACGGCVRPDASEAGDPRSSSCDEAPSRRIGKVRAAAEARILRAAETVFARAGYAAATMAAIAHEAGCPKANVHYYFRTKQDVYRAVLDHILALWLAETEVITPQADPAQALAAYVRAKMRLTAQRPEASRVFANEVLHGAPQIGAVLRGPLKALVDEKAAVMQGWIDAGRMAPVDPRHLLFTLWAATQTYADFGVQVCAVLGVKALTRAHLDQASDELVRFVLAGCGLVPAGGAGAVPAEACP